LSLLTDRARSDVADLNNLGRRWACRLTDTDAQLI